MKTFFAWVGGVVVVLAVLGALFDAPSPTTPKRVVHIPACGSSHYQLVIVPVECGNADICEAPIIAEVCDKLSIPVQVPGAQ